MLNELYWSDFQQQMDVARNRHNRHGDVIVKMVEFGVHKPVTKDAIQGFIGLNGEFLDRLEAFEIVKANGQNIRPLERSQLYSEDIW